jgi:hypothetical protein
MFPNRRRLSGHHEKHNGLKARETKNHANLVPFHVCYITAVLEEKVIILDEVGICSSVASAKGRTTNEAAPKRRRNHTTKSAFCRVLTGKFRLMEHRGVHYLIRVGIERGLWHVSIQPPGDALPKERTIFGTREEAENAAHSMINRWLSRRRQTNHRRLVRRV